MKRIVTVLLCLMCTMTAVGESRDSLLVMFWNLENFFDYDGVGGPEHWSKKRFYTKCNAVGKTLLWAADQMGRMPDAVGFAELENAFVLRKIIQSDVLRKYNYGFVHYDSPDPRGIDVGLIYNKGTLTVLSSCPHEVNGGTTRDILEVLFRTVSGDTLSVFVNHHPSKYGGSTSAEKRVGAMRSLRQVVDAHERYVICMGDFNDTPDGEAFAEIEGKLTNLAEPLYERGEGTIRYDGQWELIDMFLVSSDIETALMSILYPPFLMTKDSAHSGVKPLRTFSGPRYLGGVSDHLPIALFLGGK